VFSSRFSSEASRVFSAPSGGFFPPLMAPFHSPLRSSDPFCFSVLIFHVPLSACAPSYYVLWRGDGLSLVYRPLPFFFFSPEASLIDVFTGMARFLFSFRAAFLSFLPPFCLRVSIPRYISILLIRMCSPHCLLLTLTFFFVSPRLTVDHFTAFRWSRPSVGFKAFLRAHRVIPHYFSPMFVHFLKPLLHEIGLLTWRSTLIGVD